MEREFWNWFQENHLEYLKLDTVDNAMRELMLDKLLNKLHEYCDRLFYQIGGISDTRRELVITAEGDASYFGHVKKLVELAPVIDEWEIIAFKQSVEDDVITNYKGIVLNPQNIWFEPLEAKDKSLGLGLRLYISSYDEPRHNDIINGMHEVLDNILGELLAAKEISYIEVLKLPSDTSSLIPLTDLKSFVKWRMTK